MEQRYHKLFTLPENLYAEGCPIVIEAGALQLDTAINRVIAQLKLFSVSPKALKSVAVSIIPKDSAGRVLDEKIVHNYLDITAKREERFGSKEPIFISNNITRGFDVSVDECVFADGSLWTSEGAAFEPLPEKKEIVGNIFTKNSLVHNEYLQLFGESSKYIYCDYKDLRICTCGAYNGKESKFCHNCGASLDTLRELDFTEFANQTIYNTAKECLEAIDQTQDREEKKEFYAKAKMLFEKVSDWRDAAEFIPICAEGYNSITAEQEAEMLEAKRQAELALKQSQERTKKIVKISSIIVLSIIAVIIGAVITTDVIIPEVNYSGAQKLQENGSYSEAIEKYEALEDYKKSKEKIRDCTYLLAKQQLEKGEYEQAYNNFKAVINHWDSRDKIVDAAIGYAKELIANKEYILAKDVLTAVKTNDEIKALIRECNIEGSKQLYDKGEYQKAITWYKSVSGYNKNSEFLKKCYYQYGKQLLDQESYDKAVSFLELAGDYKDAKAKINATKYSYVLTNKNNSNQKTFEYLKDLKAVGYKDSATIYKDLYSWTVSLEANNSYSSNYTSVSSYIPDYCSYYHMSFRVSGGTPGEEATLVNYTRWGTGGSKKRASWKWEDVKDGESIGIEWSNGYTAFNSDKFTIWIYNAKTGAQVGVFTFPIY